MKFYKNKTKGFTLIEIMVATSIFMVIMLIALGALISSSDTAKKSQALRSAMDNVNFAMESMTRSLRMGTDYYCLSSGQSVDLANPPALSSHQDCPITANVEGKAIVFTSADALSPRSSAYRVVPRNDSAGTSVLQKCAPTCTDLVSSNVDIQKLTFFVDGTNPIPIDTKQPSVYILIKGIVIVKGVPNTFAIQTMASQRSSE